MSFKTCDQYGTFTRSGYHATAWYLNQGTTETVVPWSGYQFYQAYFSWICARTAHIVQMQIEFQVIY